MLWRLASCAANDDDNTGALLRASCYRGDGLLCDAGYDREVRQRRRTRSGCHLGTFLIRTAVTGAVMLPSRGRAIFKTRHPWLQILRGMLTAVSSVLGLISLQTLAVADFTAIIMLIPMVITVVSSTHLKVRIPVLGWHLLLGGLAGALLVLRPGASGFQWGMLLSLGAVVFNSGFQLLTSYLSKDDDPQTMHFYTGVVATALFTLTLPFFWKPSTSLWVCALLYLWACATRWVSTL